MSPISWGWANSFSFVVISRIDQRSRSLWRDILLVLAVHHQIHKCCFCCLWAIVRGCFLSSFRHGTNHKALSGLRKKTLEVATTIHREIHDVEQFLTHVSLWDFVLWLSFWSQLHCLQNVQLRLSLRRMCVGSYVIHFTWVLVLESQTAQVSLCPVWLGWILFTFLTLQSPCPKERELIAHPSAIQHPDKWLQTL